ncbi:MAG: hypothetical protein QME57_01390 [Patescibacteria group bacterium]|nr:hypothetical protein [Patescibacteria group bacterium]
MDIMVTERQEQLLNTVIQEYINLAQPVSSQLIERRCNFGICSATIRIDMQKLTDAGFLYQPHTSAGRVPTDKGYRFFVNHLLEKGFFDQLDSEVENWVREEIRDTVKFIQFITKKIAALSSNLALAYLFNKKILWKEGWEEILQEPEFKEEKFVSGLAELLKNFEEEIEEFKINSGIKIYIGKENPFSKAKDFSIIISKCHFPQKQQGILAILGPKRMSYEKNIGSLNSLIKLLEKY